MQITAEVAGEVVEVADGLDDGSWVSDGQVILRLDDRQYLQQVERTAALAAELQAQLENLDVEKENIRKLIAIAQREVQVNEDELQRVTGLFERQQASSREFDFARLAYERSRRELQGLENQLDLIPPRRGALEASRRARQAEAELARLDVERCTISAPFAGQIHQLLVERGDRVLPGGALLRLIDPLRIEVPVELPVSVRPHVDVGAECVLEVDSMPGVQWAGRLNRVSSLADERSRTFPAYVEVDNTEQSTPLIAGYFVRAKVRGPLLRQVLAIPRGAVLGKTVFVVNGEQAHTREIQVDYLVGEWAVISGEIAPGDQVILTNLDVLYAGAPIRCAEGDGAAHVEPAVAVHRDESGGQGDG